MEIKVTLQDTFEDHRQVIPEHSLLVAILQRAVLDFFMWRERRKSFGWWCGREDYAALLRWFSDADSSNFGSFGYICDQLGLEQCIIRRAIYNLRHQDDIQLGHLRRTLTRG